MKKILAIMLSAMLVTSITGCNGGGDDEPVQDSDVSEVHETLGTAEETEEIDVTTEADTAAIPESGHGLPQEELSEFFWSQVEGVWLLDDPTGNSINSFIQFTYSDSHSSNAPTLWRGLFASEALPEVYLTDITRLNPNEYELTFYQPYIPAGELFFEFEEAYYTHIFDVSEIDSGILVQKSGDGSVFKYTFLAKTFDAAYEIWSNDYL